MLVLPDQLTGRFPDRPPLPPWLVAPAELQHAADEIDANLLRATPTGVEFALWTLLGAELNVDDLLDLGANLGDYLARWAMGIGAISAKAGLDAPEAVTAAWDLQKLGYLTLHMDGIEFSGIPGAEAFGLGPDPGFTSLDRLVEVWDEQHA